MCGSDEPQTYPENISHVPDWALGDMRFTKGDRAYYSLTYLLHGAESFLSS